jgi:hypothetical protein
MEQALIDHVRQNPELSVDDMLWWLWESHNLVVGSRTIRRVFERKGDKVKIKGSKRKGGTPGGDDVKDERGISSPKDDAGMPTPGTAQYQSPYAPMAQQTALHAEQQLAQALQQQAQQSPQQHHQQQSQQQSQQQPQQQPQQPQQPQQQQQQQQMQSFHDLSTEPEADLPDDEETIQLQLQQIALQKREVELKLKMRRLQSGRNTPASNRPPKTATPGSASTSTSTLYNPHLVVPSPPKRDSRSKKKIEESKRRTAERQERMLRDLERRSRRRDHLTAEWVQSKDIWPLRAQGLLADLMHQYGCYAFSQPQVETFEAMYQELYQLVDLAKGDWVPQIHDEMLRERMKRKMGQLRTKMQKTGEIIARTDGYGGFQKADNYTGEQAGAAEGDESEMMNDLPDPGGAYPPPSDHNAYQPPPVPAGYEQQAGGAPDTQMHDPIPYDAVPDPGAMQAHTMPYTHLMGSQTPQYPGMHLDHNQMLPYGQMNGMNL